MIDTIKASGILQAASLSYQRAHTDRLQALREKYLAIEHETKRQIFNTAYSSWERIRGGK